MHGVREREQRSDVLKRTWDGRVEQWHTHVSDTPAFATIRDSLLRQAAPKDTDVAVDLGAGTGFITLPLAAQVKTILAVDVSDAMLNELKARATTGNVHTSAVDLDQFDLRAGSVDLVVSNYALHHLTDPQKFALLRRSYDWLRPGGRIVIADMMLGRGLSARDRSIARQKILLLIRRGPAGVWRIVKNLVRFSLRVGTERPVGPNQWAAMLRRVGFVDVGQADVVAEAGLVWAVKRNPEPAAASGDGS